MRQPRPSQVSPAKEPERIELLVLGASFAGLELLSQLRRRGYWRKHPKARVCVVDKVAESAYIPLIHEELFDAPSTVPRVDFPRFLQGLPGLHFIQGCAVEVDFQSRSVRLKDGTQLQAETLVVALGSQLQVPAGLDPDHRCRTLKWAGEVEPLRAELEALSEPSSIAIVGGGLTGVELAGEIAYRIPGKHQVHLIHGGAELLPALSARAGAKAQVALRKLGVRLHLEHRLAKVGATQLTLLDRKGKSSQLKADLVCWAGGIAGPSSIRWVGVEASKEGWLDVDPCLRPWSAQGEAHAQCFVCGDLASIRNAPGDPVQPTMRRAIEAIWQARTVAKNLCRDQGQACEAHPLRLSWPHGVSVGATSLICYGQMAIDLKALGRWFRRWLGAMYLRRYGIRP